MVVEPTIEERLKSIEHILDITNGYKPMKTIKAVAKGTAEGTANFMGEMSFFRHEINKKFDKIDKQLLRLIKIIKS